MMQPGWPKRALVVFGVGSLLGAAAAVGAPLCPTAALFGVPCPGCGLTRATLALLHGKLGAALDLHPLVFVLTPVYAFAVGIALLSYVRGMALPNDAAAARAKSLVTSRAFTLGATALLVLVIGVWVARFFGAFGGPAPVETLMKVPS